MEVTTEDVETIEEAHSIVLELIQYAEEQDSTVFNLRGLSVLEYQLETLHSSLAMVVSGNEL